MMVTFVSQCEKKALNRTRRVLDAFADRIGDNTWQTVITQEGLLAVKKLLRKTASKNTAVSCHWIRSRSRTDLVWVVGNKQKFNGEGLVPVNSTTVNRTFRDDEADWYYLPLIQSLASLAALLHDWGKASARFQEKLDKEYKGEMGDALRHEWISCLLFKALIANTDSNTDSGWLALLANGEIDETSLVETDLEKVRPLVELPPIAKLVAWLIVTHHRMPLPRIPPKELLNKWAGYDADSIEKVFLYTDESWGYQNEKANATLQDCMRFPQGLITNSNAWLKSLKRWAKKLLDHQHSLVEQIVEGGSYRPILHHARLCLMLGDHYYSSLTLKESGVWRNNTGLIANTQKDGSPKQALDQHLIGVYQQAKRNAQKLPQLEREFPVTDNITALKKKSLGQFDWQDKAASEVRDWNFQHKNQKHGFFAVNMASTGCGKTFANAKVMLALSENNDSLRYILALGLRTLTLQTGDEYRERIFQHSDGSDLAVLIGSKAIADLHNQDHNWNEPDKPANERGSESQESLLDAGEEVFYDSDIPEDGLATVLPDEKARKFLYAPILACTIDHIMAATETMRGGRYILPCLRLMSSDLVIDEIDDFIDADAIAIGRLIHLSGMLGRKVMISSATIPPALAEGYFNCYREGWQLFTKTRNARPVVGCAWIDEFNTVVVDNSSTGAKQANLKYAESHKVFIKKRVEKLSQQPARRKAEIIDCQSVITQKSADNGTKQSAYFDIIVNAALAKHRQHHQTDQRTGLNVSFGLIRIANISPCIALTRFLLDYPFPENMVLRVMPYHSQQVLLLRHEQEKHLDAVLKRKEKQDDEPASFSNNVIREHLDGLAAEKDKPSHVLFILVATPVEEIGRDHDFDWAIVEPSSYRSIIQLAGRVRRHRSDSVQIPNIGILQYNWRTVKKGDEPLKPRFYWPGYESNSRSNEGKTLCFKTHDLKQLLDEKQIELKLDAIPRISNTSDTSRFAALEHAVIESQLTDYKAQGPESLQGYLAQHWYLTALPQALNRFRKSESSIQLFKYPEENNELFFMQRDERGKLFRDSVYGEPVNMAPDDIQLCHMTLKQQERLWLVRNYRQLLASQATEMVDNLQDLALRYGEIIIREPREFESGIDYLYNDHLGLFVDERR